VAPRSAPPRVRPTRRRRPRPAPAAVGLALLLVVASALAAAPASGAAPPARVRSFDLGRVRMPDPSPFGPIPVHVWGALGVPSSPGRHGVVVVVHGRHSIGCPVGPGDVERWPCFRREARNDLGLRHVVAALAARGMAAVTVDVNPAFTFGWGEPAEGLRWRRLVDLTLAALARENRAGGGRFGIALRGRLDLRRLGILAHSLSGRRAVQLVSARMRARSARKVATGRGRFRSLFLLTPVFAGTGLPDVPTAIVLASCDGDTGGQGRRYLSRARRTHRRRPVWLAELARANHNFFNARLARRHLDDAAGERGDCRRGRRLRARIQQRWLDRAAADFFATTLRGARAPRWLRRRGILPHRLYGLRAAVARFAP
jgi:hypothetical protein